MKRLTAVFLGFLAISSMVAADPLYKWVDAQGNLHYSDKPQPGAKKIVLPTASTYNPANMANTRVATGSDAKRAANSGPDAKAAQTPAGGYTSVAISTPGNQETLWNTDSVTVSVAIAPGLKQGDSVTIVVDGSAQTVQGSSATFTGLDKGQHTASASVGSLKAADVTFFIQKTSIIKPPIT